MHENDADFAQRVAGWLDDVEFVSSNAYALQVIDRWSNSVFVDNGMRRLMSWAIENRCLPLVRRLVELGLPLGVDECGDSPLFDALLVGNQDAAAFLIDSGADLENYSHGGYLPIHLAAQQGLIKPVEQILSTESGRSGINRKSLDENLTPLQLALNGGHDRVASLLRRHGGR